MALTYSILTGLKTVQGSIRNWVNRTDTPATTVLAEAEAWIYERLRVREMTQTDTLTFAINTSSTNLPADFLDPIAYEPWQWATDLEYVNEGALKAHRDATGALLPGSPSKWAVVGLTAEVDVSCVTEFSGHLIYYGTPDPLSDTNETNFLTNRYPTLLRRACLAVAYEHAKQPAAMRDELALAEKAYLSANTSNELFRRGQNYPGGGPYG